MAKWSGAVSYVPQDVVISNGTIRENVALGYPAEVATDDLVMSALKVANLDEFVAGLPEGADTPVGERGVSLSLGQRQLICFARAMIADPRILILDDALSSVDTVTEAQILEKLGAVMKGRTTFLISHRVSTMRYADRILVLKQGKIAEIGTSAELLARHGYYASLVRKQQLEEEIDSV